MRIWADDIHAIKETLHEQLQQGNHIVAYNEALGFATKRDLVFCADKESFDKYAQLHNNDHALYFEWNTGDVLRCVEAVLNHKIKFDKNELVSYAEGMYTFHDPSATANIEALKNQMKELGFDERIFHAVDFFYGLSYESFNLLQRERSHGEKHMYYLHFVQQPNERSYRLDSYEATLRIEPEIPDVTVAGINARMLDARMKEVDWSIDHHTESLFEEYIKTKEGEAFLDKIDAILEDVKKLVSDGGEGKDAAERLMFKHWD